MSGMRCDICLQFLIPESDSYKWITVDGKKVMGYGRITFVHTAKCVPAPAPVYEQEDEEDESRLPARACKECGKRFVPKVQGQAARLCGPECRKRRRERKYLDTESRRGKDWKLRVLKQLKLPTRECVECKGLFTQSTKFSNKQMICSAECRAKRLARQTKERRAA